MSTKAAPAPRIASMDQFRGYTVAGMFLVNFMSSFAAIHSVLKHNDNYFSYADSIMPSFMFAVGFSFRLTYLRRSGQMSTARRTWSYLKRSLALVVVSLVMYGFGGEFHKWFEFDEMPVEYKPFHEKAPRNASFDFLLAKAREGDSGKDFRAQIDRAAKTGEFAPKDVPTKPDEKARYDLAQQAANLALADGQKYVDSAVERRRSWEALRPSTKLLVHWRILAAKLLKSNLWETLAIIGVSQLVVMPFIGMSFAVRLCALIGLGVTHLVISYWFNWDFVYALHDNWMSKLWMTGDSRSWDGGFFGPIVWATAMMGGTLAYDIVASSASSAHAARRLVAWGAAFMIVGYAMSCLTRLYELNDEELEVRKEKIIHNEAEKGWLGHVIELQEKRIGGLRKPLSDLRGAIGDQKRADFLAVYNELKEKPENKGLSKHTLADMAERQQKENPRANARLKELKEQETKLKKDVEPAVHKLEGTISVMREQQRVYPNLQLAESPVMPPWERIKGRSFADLIVEPPFVQPPHDEPRVDPGPHIEHRPRNYWMMGKRMPNLSFMIFATGFAFALYGLFVVACDIGGMRIGLFATFGTNALAAYFLHHVVSLAVEPLVPHDAKLWYCLAGFAAFFLLTYWCVRYLEKRNIFVKL